MVSVRSRYEGTDGARRLVEALRQQRIVEHDEDVARALAETGTLVELDPGDALVEQGGADTDVYLLLDGDVDILVNSRLIARRGAGESIGEMVVTDATARRSASAVARSPVLAWKVDEPAFTAIAHTFPKLWKPIAKVLASRLRERNKFHRPPNPQPFLFVGSSVEGLPIANELVT